jgi:rod shape-determining protein MreD
MRTGFLSRLDHFARGLLPLICTLSVVLLSALPLRLPMAAMVAPSLTLIAVYYWTIYRPDLLNGFFILVLGLLQDLLTGAPPGVTSLVLLLAYLVVVSQRRFFHGKSFSVVWWIFMLVAIGAAIVAWLCNFILSGRWIDPTGSAIGLLLTILLYPPLAALLSQVHKLVPARDADA